MVVRIVRQKIDFEELLIYFTCLCHAHFDRTKRTTVQTPCVYQQIRLIFL